MNKTQSTTGMIFFLIFHLSYVCVFFILCLLHFFVVVDDVAIYDSAKWVWMAWMRVSIKINVSNECMFWRLIVHDIELSFTEIYTRLFSYKRLQHQHQHILYTHIKFIYMYYVAVLENQKESHQINNSFRLRNGLIHWMRSEVLKLYFE